MNKRLIAALALILAVGAGAFGQLAVGVSGALYTDTELTASEISDRFQKGDGIFYGPFIELGLGTLSLGFSANFSFYNEDWSVFGLSNEVKMMDVDATLYAQGHLFGYKAILDPFVEVGFGAMAKDYANDEDDPDTENPLLKTGYFELGGGLGLNLGALGIFGKLIYMFPSDDPATAEVKYYDEFGVEHTFTYDLAQYPLRKMKFFLGGKIIL